ncbi:MAG: S24 family peptidase [Motiliproteus sp.]
MLGKLNNHMDDRRTMARRPLTECEIETAQRLKSIFVAKKKQLGITQQTAAERLGWSAASVVNQYLSGAIALNLEAGLKFARLLDVAPSEISPAWAEYDSLHDSGEARSVTPEPDRHDDYVHIPVYDELLAAGSGFAPNGDSVKEYISLPSMFFTRSNLNPAGLVVAHASGDSMSPKIEDGDALIIDTHQQKPVDNQVFAFADEGDLRVKRFAKQIGGTWAIRSDNLDPIYRDEIISPLDVGRIKIIGRVVKVIGSV